jgi:hypothetical protein
MKKDYKNLEIQKKNQTELRELEEFYTTNTVSTMLDKIEDQKAIITNDIINFAETNRMPVEWNSDGDIVRWEQKQINPLVINNYFFKSIVPITSQEPVYNAEKLGMVFDYYCHILAEVNDRIGYFPSSLTSFCKLAGITLNTLRNYKSSQDYSMRVVAEKIYDQIGDENITMSQMGIVKERSTIFKMKSQNELVEKQQPKINVNITERPDMEKIANRLNEYKKFASKKDKKR